MESPPVKAESNSRNLLDSTLEFPAIKTVAREKVDILLPDLSADWRGPALQSSAMDTPFAENLMYKLDDSITPPGMLRPVDTTYSQTSASSAPAPPEVRSYARRSTRRGRAYTVLFTFAIMGGVAWMYFKFDAITPALLRSFQ